MEPYYQAFLASKRMTVQSVGREVPDSAINPVLFPFQRDLTLWALRKGRSAIFADTGLGKALAAETPVLTPNGYTPIGKLNPGDLVMASDGGTAHVIGVYPQGTRPAYRVSFTDGASVVCDLEHLWSVRTKVQRFQRQGFRPKSLASIMGEALTHQSGWRHFIPIASSMQFAFTQLPLDPYLLGVLLGDGCFRAGVPTISSADPEILASVSDALPEGVTLQRASGYDWRISAGSRNGHRPNPLTTALRLLGLMGEPSGLKFVPSDYKFAHQAAREALLQGLLDTDGHVRPTDNNIEYTTVSPRLAGDVAFLVQSLGGTARIRTKETGFQRAYRMSVILPCNIRPFRLLRKADVYHPRSKYQPTRAIASVECIGEAEMVCIAVDSPDHCYVVEHCIVTHNTLMQLEWARLIGEGVLIIAPLSVARQTVREGRKIDVDARYVRSHAEVTSDHGISITNYEMIDNFDLSRFGAVVLDECFRPDTQLDIPGGRKYIQDIQRGDWILNAAGEDRVEAVYKRCVDRAIRVGIGGRYATCSANHPFLTMYGWRCAQDLQPGDYVMATRAAMRLVRNDLPTEVMGPENAALLRSILLSEMENEYARALGQGSQSPSRQETRVVQVTLVSEQRSDRAERIGENHKIESDEQPCNKGESVIPIAGNVPQTFRAWGQWSGHDEAPADIDGCVTRRMDSGICFVTGPTDSRLSHALQTRLSESRTQNRYRGGWELAPLAESTRPEEGCQVDFVRVDGIEILEPGHPELERYRDADGFVYFYDIKGTRHPSYSVNGSLVHNSSILKALSGATRQKLTRICANIPYRLCCTATPAPNDYTELGNHAQFLGICTTAEMLATYFVNANKQQAIVHEGRIYEKKGSNKGGQEWRLKHHAEDAFFRWLASWAITLSKPSDLGYDDDGFILPPLTIMPTAVPFERVTKGQLIDTGLHGIGDRVDARRASLSARLERLTSLVNGNAEQWIVWVGLDDESRAVTAAIEGAVEVKGIDSPESKATSIEAFQDGQYRVLVSKAKIAGYGLNLQNASRMAFFGLSDSWEAFYQCIRREWRYRQESPVDVHIVMSTAEEAVLANVMRKDALAKRLREKLVAAVRDYERSELRMASSINVGYNAHVDCTLPAWIGGLNESGIHLRDLREAGQRQAQPSYHEDTAAVLQPEMQWASKAQSETGAKAKCRVSLPELRDVSSDIQEPIGSQELHPEVLQPEVFRGDAEGSRKPGVGRWATLPEWVRGGLSA